MASTTNAVILTGKGEVRNCKLPVGSATNSILTEAQLMGVLKRKTEPEEIGTYKHRQLRLTCFGYTTGRAGTESKHTLPAPHDEDVCYGDILVVAWKKGASWARPTAFSAKEYEEFYEQRLMGDGEDGDEGEDEGEDGEEDGADADADADIEEVVDADADEEDLPEEVVEEDEEAVVDSEEEEEEEDDEDADEAEDGSEGSIGGGLGEDDDEIVITKTKGKKKSVPKPTNAAAHTGRGKQTYLLQKGTIHDSESIHEGPYHERLLALIQHHFGDSYIQSHAEDLCAVIEDCACAEAERRGIVRHHANPLFQTVYKAVVRRILGNIDPSSYVQNEHLHKQLQSGDLSLETLRSMSTLDMNPGLYKELYDRQLLREQAQLEGNKAMTSELFTCSRCKKNQCTYYQLQTRSADEPMTTFITCLNCNKRWKE
jgi:DNA-directed RNA polymerase subunit M/transcription elongation factor TFIIS